MTSHQKAFSIREAVRFGWQTSKRNIGFFAGLLFIAVIISLLPIFIGNFIPREYFIINLFFQLSSKILGIVVYLGLIRISLKFCDGEKGRINDLWSTFHLLLKYIPAIILAMTIFYGIFFIFLGISYILGKYAGENLAVSIIIFFGVVALIVFFLIWTIRLSLFPYFIVDEGQGPVKALKSSYAATHGLTIKLMLFELVLGVINFLGLAALFFGLIITIPIYLMAKARVYRILSG